MICLKCGKKIPSRDKYCGYCGASTGLLPIRLLLNLGERLPKRFKLLILITAIAIIATVVVLLVVQSQQKVLRMGSEIFTGDIDYQEGVVVYSEYVVSEAPNIDVVITAGEWADPAVSMKFNFYEEKTNTHQPGEALFYYMNDRDCLYIALTLSSLEPDMLSFDKEDIEFSCTIVFDGDNDGFPIPGDDAKRLDSAHRNQLPVFRDVHVDPEGDEESDEQEDGEGACGYRKDTSTWVGEFRIPLNSGDPQDLAIQSGDTIGVRWEIRAWQMSSDGIYRHIGGVEWPIWAPPSVLTGEATPPPCRSLVLASAPESAALEASP